LKFVIIHASKASYIFMVVIFFIKKNMSCPILNQNRKLLLTWFTSFREKFNPGDNINNDTTKKKCYGHNISMTNFITLPTRLL
jgi:hypothetical protein